MAVVWKVINGRHLWRDGKGCESTRAGIGRDTEDALGKVVKELNAWLPKLITAAAMPHG